MVYLSFQIKNFQKKYCLTICKENEFLGSDTINGLENRFPLTSIRL